MIEHNLLDVRKAINNEKKLPKDEKEVFVALKPYIRKFSVQEFDNLYEGILLQKLLMQRLNQLKYFQSIGLNSYEQVNDYLFSDIQAKEAKNSKLIC